MAAVNKILDRQGRDGAFGLWRVSDGYATPWLGAYVTDFLYRAGNEGYAVPKDAMDRSYAALQRITNTSGWFAASYQGRANEGAGSNDKTVQLRRRSAAYAFFVLARAGRADLSDLRYFHDALLETTVSPLAKAHLGAALNFVGDRSRSLNAFAAARASIGFENTGNYYQTSLRDVAGVLSLLADVQNAPGLDDLSADFESVAHLVPMLSLGNSYNEEDLVDFDRRIRDLTKTD